MNIWFSNNNMITVERHSETFETSKMELFARPKAVKYFRKKLPFRRLTGYNSVLNIWNSLQKFWKQLVFCKKCFDRVMNKKIGHINTAALAK